MSCLLTFTTTDLFCIEDGGVVRINKKDFGQGWSTIEEVSLRAMAAAYRGI